MRYIANSEGYLLEVSFGADIQCNGWDCMEYTGGVPEGYADLVDWFAAEGDKLHRWYILRGDLTLDEDAPEPEVYVEPEPEVVPTTVLYKIWENTSPTSSFSAQTIALDLSKYSMIICNCRLSTTHATIVPMNPIPVGAGYGAYAYGLEGGYHTRRTITANAGGVEVEGGMKYTTFGSSNVNSSNDSLIPVVIYGIRGVVTLPTAVCGTFICGGINCGT